MESSTSQPFDVGDLVSIDRPAMIVGTCPNCRRAGSFARSKDFSVWPTHRRGADVLRPSEFPRVDLQVWSCLFCRKTTTLALILEGENDDLRARVEYIWPTRPPRELPVEAPDLVRTLYREASVAEGVGAFRAAAGMYRACVEALVADRNANGHNLDQQIDDLANQGVDQDLVEDLHEARVTGNWSLHQGLEFSAAEVADIASLIYQSVFVLYVQPVQRQRMRDARAARRTDRGG
jgi:hypothetical protein